MPELPEVETIVRELKGSILGKKIWNIESKDKTVFTPDANTILQRVQGVRVIDVIRRGKFIIFVLDQKLRMVVHLRMTGRLLWKTVRAREKYVRAVILFSDATSLIFSDTRKFGHIWYGTEKEIDKISGMWRLGPEPLTLSKNAFMSLFSQKRGILKNMLLAQNILAGIGNIYADEICFQAGLHPTSHVEALNVAQIEKLYQAVQYCLEEGIQHCGVSVSDFVGTRGTLGKHQNYLRVYGRKGDECYVCGSTIVKIRAASRGTFFCPVCQPVLG